MMPLSYQKSLPKHCSVLTGQASIRSTNIECGQFDDEFVEALKGRSQATITHLPLELTMSTYENIGTWFINVYVPVLCLPNSFLS